MRLTFASHALMRVKRLASRQFQNFHSWSEPFCYLS
jgi:hypothetical protein